MSKQAIDRKTNKSGVIYCLCKDIEKNTYEVWVLRENYDGKCNGGIRKTWRYVKVGMEKIQAVQFFNKKVA